MRQIADDHLGGVHQLGRELSVRDDDHAKLHRVPDPSLRVAHVVRAMSRCGDARAGRPVMPGQPLLQRLGDRHRAMPAAGAADPDRQVRLALVHVLRDQELQQVQRVPRGTRAWPPSGRGSASTSGSRPVCGRSAGTKCGFGRNRTSNSRSESTGMPCLKPKLRIVTTSWLPGARPLADAGEGVPQLVHRHLGGVDDVVRHAADRRMALRSSRMPSIAERSGASGCGRRVSLNRRTSVASCGLEEDQHRVEVAHRLQPRVDRRELRRAACLRARRRRPRPGRSRCRRAASARRASAAARPAGCRRRSSRGPRARGSPGTCPSPTARSARRTATCTAVRAARRAACRFSRIRDPLPARAPASASAAASSRSFSRSTSRRAA